MTSIDGWIKCGDTVGAYGLSIESSFAEDAMILEEYELGIFFSSFESRCTVSPTKLRKASLKTAILILYEESIDTPQRKANDKILRELISRVTVEEVHEVCVSVKDVEIGLDKVFAVVPRAALRSNVRWFIDIGGGTTPYFLGVLAALRECFGRFNVTVFNPTAVYTDRGESPLGFTAGFDRMLLIPRLWGRIDPCKSRKYVFFIGHEGSRSFEVFDSCEPDAVEVVTGDPGYEDGYAALAIANNRQVLDEIGCGPKGVRKANAADPVEVWETLSDIVKNGKGFNHFFVPIGPKGHALGAGLFAMAHKECSVLYHLPRSYKVRDVPRGRLLWRYEVRL